MKDFGKVYHAVRCGQKVDPMFFVSWNKAILKSIRPGDRVGAPVVELPHHYAAEAIARSFLQSDCDSVFFADDDMVFEPEHLDYLRDDRDNFEYDIVQALCLSRNPPHRPVILEPYGEGKLKSKAIPEKNTVVPVGLAGLAFTIIRREVFERIDKIKTKGEMYFRWGAKGESEDAMFTALALETGCKVGVNTKICIGHRIPVVIRWNWEELGVDYEECDRGAGRLLNKLKEETENDRE